MTLAQALSTQLYFTTMLLVTSYSHAIVVCQLVSSDLFSYIFVLVLFQ